MAQFPWREAAESVRVRVGCDDVDPPRPRPLESRLTPLQTHDDHPHVPGPSLWPVGFAVGVVVLMIGLVISWWITGLGALLALVFGFLWVRDLTVGTELTHTPEIPPESAPGAAAPVGAAAAPTAASMRA